MALFSFTGQTQQDPTTQAGLQQYADQGQAQISPGQSQIAASNPVAFAGMQGLAKALAGAQQNGVPAQQFSNGQAAMQIGANAGMPGPTNYASALANGLQAQPNMQVDPRTGFATPQAFLNGGQ